MEEIDQSLLNNTNILKCVQNDHILMVDKLRDLQELLNKIDLGLTKQYELVKDIKKKELGQFYTTNYNYP
jgi:hypothetical protein